MHAEINYKKLEAFTVFLYSIGIIYQGTTQHFDSSVDKNFQSFNYKIIGSSFLATAVQFDLLNQIRRMNSVIKNFFDIKDKYGTYTFTKIAIEFQYNEIIVVFIE